MDSDFSELDNSQLCSIFDGLSGGSDFKNAIVAEMSKRLAKRYKGWFILFYCGDDDQLDREHREWLEVYERVKNSWQYWRACDDAFAAEHGGKTRNRA